MTEVKKTANPTKKTTSTSAKKELEAMQKKHNAEMEEMKRQIELLTKAVTNQTVSIDTSSDSIDLDEDIDVISLCNGKLNLSTGGFGKGEIYEFFSFGEIVPVPFRNLKEIVKNNKSFLEKGYYFVDSQKARKALRITSIYEKLPKAQELIELLNKDQNVVSTTLKRMTIEQKTMIASIVVGKLFNNEKIDMNIVKEIGDSVGKDLTIVARNKRDLVSGGEK